MLKVLDVMDLGAETIRTSAYTFTLEWPDSLGDAFYWRAGLVSDSFIEVGIHYRTGRMKSISIPTARQVSSWPAERSSITAMGLPEQNGAPVFHVEDAWRADGPDEVTTFDAPDDFWVRVGEHRVALDFGDYKHVVTCIRSGRVSFGVDQEGLLHTIEVENLTDEEMSNLRQRLRFSGWLATCD